MFVSSQISDTQRVIREAKLAGKTIGFVPTMGALHQGHMSLVQAARNKCDFVVASVYVNPTQFNNADDLHAYPKTLKEDLEKLKTHQCDLVFTPSDEVMYPEKAYISIDFGKLGSLMEGEYRPGHFSGVGQIVTKLFNIIQPDQAFFGQKDFQQLSLIKRLVKEFCFPITIQKVATAREAHGLAMSSRNERLNPTLRQEAKIFYDALCLVKNLIEEEPMLDFKQIKEKVSEKFKDSNADLEYLEIVSDHNLIPKRENYLETDTVICIAGFIGNVRLIDNIYLIS